MDPVPDEYLCDAYFERVRRRFKLCGTKVERDGIKLVLSCLGCGLELHYPWLKKRFDQKWVGEFGDRVKARLNSNHSHRKCKTASCPSVKDMEALRAENKELRNQIMTTITAPTMINNNNIVIVNLPAVTRIGSTGKPLMCSDIPYPDDKTVRKLLTNPESAVPDSSTNSTHGRQASAHPTQQTPN